MFSSVPRCRGLFGFEKNTSTSVSTVNAAGAESSLPRSHVRALEMAHRSRGGRRLVGLVTHADVGSQLTSVPITERLEEIGARPSIGTVAHSYDNALVETTNGLYKTKCVHRPNAPRPSADAGELELATLSWVRWFNDDRLHSHCRDLPPTAFEAAFYAAH